MALSSIRRLLIVPVLALALLGAPAPTAADHNGHDHGGGGNGNGGQCDAGNCAGGGSGGSGDEAPSEEGSGDAGSDDAGGGSGEEAPEGTAPAGGGGTGGAGSGGVGTQCVRLLPVNHGPQATTNPLLGYVYISPECVKRVVRDTVVVERPPVLGALYEKLERHLE